MLPEVAHANWKRNASAVVGEAIAISCVPGAVGNVTVFCEGFNATSGQFLVSGACNSAVHTRAPNLNYMTLRIQFSDSVTINYSSFDRTKFHT